MRGSKQDVEEGRRCLAAGHSSVVVAGFPSVRDGMYVLSDSLMLTLHEATMNQSAGVVRPLLDFFSSIWLGVILLTVLFVYSAVGSAGFWIPGQYAFVNDHDWAHELTFGLQWTQLHIRQAPGLEMTEFEWFHWWPFNLLIAMICINLVVATIRRIPFNTLNLGVWMIHTGIIIIAVGSVMYFWTKLEGEAPIIRRAVTINLPGADPVTFPALPGNRMTVDAEDGRYGFQIASIDPNWEILSGDHRGERTFAVFVMVQGPGQPFVRTLLADFPQYTEDSIFTNDPSQPRARAINAIGERLVNERVQLSLDYKPQSEFFLVDRPAIYLREKGRTEWVQRPIPNLPRYNDYLRSRSEVWAESSRLTSDNFRPRDLKIALRASEPNDPLPDIPIEITHYVRYGFLESRRAAGGNRIDPVVSVRLSNDRGQSQDYQMIAFDPVNQVVEEGRMRFVWVENEEEFTRAGEFRSPRLRVRVPGEDIDLTVDVTGEAMGDEFLEIDGTEFAYRVDAVEDGLDLGGPDPVSVAIVQIQSPERTFQRWVFSDERLGNRDFRLGDGGAMHEQPLDIDERIQMRYLPGRRPAPVTLIGGPSEEDLHLMLAIGAETPTIQPVGPGQRVEIQPGVFLQVIAFAPRTWSETRPVIVPPEQRDRDARQQRSLVRTHVPVGTGHSAWMPFHIYPFRSRTDALRRYPFRPAEIELADGRVIELLYSRERRELPTPIALNDFILTSHIGGFTGETSSIRDWTSVVSFWDAEEGDWVNQQTISMNRPGSYGGFWYFQSFWDPPEEPRREGDQGSAGMNFTILGVGNRNGVWTQLAGSIISVFGMIYAFYVKPVIKRRRQQNVMQRLAAEQTAAAGAATESANTSGHRLEPVGATAENRT